MGKGYKHGGANPLNFKVVPGLTQPGTASKNTIWVKTEKIGAWYFSVTQPDGLQEWDVWFRTVTSSKVEFNALKKNGIQVYPIFAKQYVNGALVEVVAKSYQNGEWCDWATYLYNKGNLCEELTGGWSLQKNGADSNASAPTITYNDDSVTITHSSNNNVSRNWIPNNTIDLTNAKTVTVYVTGLTGSVYVDIRIRAKSDGIVSDKFAVQKTATVGKNEIDVSALSGEYYIAVYSFTGSGSSGSVTISEVYFA